MTSDTKSGERGFIDAQLLTTVIFSRNAVVAPRVVSSPTLLKSWRMSRWPWNFAAAVPVWR
jgi:hypothetical protein